MKKYLAMVYKQLYACFGPQHWWPGESPFEVMVGAILTQNTNWANVEKAINNLKKNKLLAPQKLYLLPEKKLAAFIVPAGYYNIKAKRLKAFIDFFFKNYNGSVKKMASRDTAWLRRELLSVKGIGPETADSILLYALNKPVFVVDAYTKRIFSRHAFISKDTDYHKVQDLFMQNIKKDIQLFNEYHALIVRLGKDFCLKKKPRCEICPLQSQKLKLQLKTQKFLVLSCSFTFCILIFAFDCFAAPCYGTRLPEKKKVFAGVQTHAIFKRYLEDEYGKMRSSQHFLLVSYGVFDWFSLDLKVGAGNIKQHPVGSDEVDYPSAFAGGYGFRLKFHDKEKTRMVLGFQHISVHPKKIKLGPIEYSGVLDDWQWSLLVSHNLGRVTPYLGTKFSRTDYIHWIGDDRKRKQSDLTKALGLVLGCDFDITERVWINLEGQLLDIEAVALSFNLSF